jgi:hypothetical protein
MLSSGKTKQSVCSSEHAICQELCAKALSWNRRNERVVKHHCYAQQVNPLAQALSRFIALANALFVSPAMLRLSLHFLSGTSEPVWPAYPAMPSSPAYEL